MWSAQEDVRNTRTRWRISQRSLCDTVTNMKSEFGKSNPCLWKRTLARTSGLFYHGDDFMILADESYLQWFAQELTEALTVKVRGVLGGDEGDLKEITLLNRILRYGLIMHRLAILGMESRSEARGHHHGHAGSGTCGRHKDTEIFQASREARMKSTKRQIVSEDHARTFRSVLREHQFYLLSTGWTGMFCSHGIGKGDVFSPNTVTWNMAKRCGRYLVGQAEHGARDS